MSINLEKIVNNFDDWREYFDPDMAFTEAEFWALSVQEKIAIIRECFPQDSDSDSDSALLPIGSPFPPLIYS